MIMTSKDGRQEKKAGVITKDGTGTGAGQKRRARFRARPSIFDHRRGGTPASSNSTFRGFYALFWVAVALFVARLAADNWRRTGSPLGENEFLRYMVSRDGALWFFSSSFYYFFIL